MFLILSHKHKNKTKQKTKVATDILPSLFSDAGRLLKRRMCVNILPTCTMLCIPWACLMWSRSEKNIRSPDTGVRNGGELLCEHWEPKPGLLWDQWVLWTAWPFLQDGGGLCVYEVLFSFALYAYQPLCLRALCARTWVWGGSFPFISGSGSLNLWYFYNLVWWENVRYTQVAVQLHITELWLRLWMLSEVHVWINFLCF